jgi:hypothetical protein
MTKYTTIPVRINSACGGEYLGCISTGTGKNQPDAERLQCVSALQSEVQTPVCPDQKIN